MINKNKLVIYLTYDGLLEPLGLSQILPYLIEIRKKHNLKIISFEKKINLNSTNLIKIKKTFKEKNINWKIIKYEKKIYFMFNFLNILFLNLYLLYLSFRNKNIIFHLRSYIPFFFILLLSLIKKTNYIFDMRGFWIQEKIDRNGWSKNSKILKILNLFEKKIILNASKIMCLTNDSIDYLKIKYPSVNQNKYICIRTAVDQNKFHYVQKDINYNNLIFCYLGTTIGAYDFNNTIEIFSNIKQRLIGSKIKIISKDSKNNILKFIKKSNLTKDDYEILDINSDNVYKELNDIDIGIFSLKKNLSIKASFPTRIAEFLICNKPIICNYFNEDILNVISDGRGLIIENSKEITSDTIEVLKNLVKSNSNKLYCRNYALSELIIEKIVPKIIDSYK